MADSKPRDVNNDKRQLSGREAEYSRVSVSSPQRIVLVLGSAPDAVQCRDWPKSGVSDIVAINNAWRLRDDWDYVVAPDDFPSDRWPSSVTEHQRLVKSRDYVPANNLFGGVFYAGGTMAFTAGYWALATLRPTVMAFLGCDMVYSKTSQTHFYGNGTADPLRRDPSLRNLEAKSARLMLHAHQMGCTCVRLSFGESRLVFPSMSFKNLADKPPNTKGFDSPLFEAAKKREEDLGYFTASGKYWKASGSYQAEEMDALDQMWLTAAGIGNAALQPQSVG